MPTHVLVHPIGTALPLVLHYRAHTVPASFVDDPDGYGLFHGNVKLSTGDQGTPHLLSAVEGDPSYGIYEFRFEPAFLDTLLAGDSYFFQVAEVGHDEEIWTLRPFLPTPLPSPPFISSGLGGGGATTTIGVPTDGDYDDGMVQGMSPATTIADAVDRINEMILQLHPLPPKLGQVNVVGDGNIFSTNYAGGAESNFKNGSMADPLGFYAISPFNPGDLQLMIGCATLIEPPPAAITFRTFNIISGLKAGTILRAYYTTDGVVWTPLGDDLTIVGTGPQTSPLNTWAVYGPGGPLDNLQLQPNGDYAGYVEFRYAFGNTATAHYLDLHLQQVIGTTTYDDYLDHYRPVGGVSGGVLVDPVTPQPTGTTQIQQPLPTPAEPDPTLRRLSGVLYAASGFPLNLQLTASDLYRSGYGPAAGGGSSVMLLNEAELGRPNETLVPNDLGSSVIPSYNAAVATGLARSVGGNPVGVSAAALPATLYHPFGDVSIGNNPVAEFCRVLTWPLANDTDLQLVFKDETRRCVQNIGAPPPSLAFDTYDFSLAPPSFTPGVPPVIWDPTQDVDYDAVGSADLGLQLQPTTLPPLASVGDGALVYPQHSYVAGIPLDGLGRNYAGRTGSRVYRSYLRTPIPTPAGRLIFGGLTAADILETGGIFPQRVRIELRIPENAAAQWGNIGVPSGLPPFFTGLMIGAPGPNYVDLAFTPGIHSTNGSTGDTTGYLQVRITYFDQGPGNNLMILDSLTFVMP
jgi:hypothetical protein